MARIALHGRHAATDFWQSFKLFTHDGFKAVYVDTHEYKYLNTFAPSRFNVRFELPQEIIRLKATKYKSVQRLVFDCTYLTQQKKV